MGEESFVSLVGGGLDLEFQKALGLVKVLVAARVGIGLNHWLGHLRKGLG